MSAKLVFLTLFSSICAGCTVHFFWQCLRAPHVLTCERWHKYVAYIYFICVWIGVGYCIFRGVEATVQWIPRSWVQYSDDGDGPMWVGDSLAGTVAFIGSILLVEEIAKIAQKLADAAKGRNR